MCALYLRLSLAIILLLCTTYGLCFMTSGAGTIMEDSREIGQKPTINFQDPPSANSTAPSGLYLNTDYPALRNGRLFSWSCCYHILGEGGSTPDVTVGIWRRAENNSFQVLPETLQSVPIDITEAQFEFVCQRFRVHANISVQVGDILGVYIPTAQSNIHIVVESSESSSLYSNESSIMSVDCALLRRAPYGLFITGSMDVTSVVPDPDSPTVISAPTPSTISSTATSTAVLTDTASRDIAPTNTIPSASPSSTATETLPATLTVTSSLVPMATSEPTTVDTEAVTESPPPKWIYWVVGAQAIIIAMILMVFFLVLCLYKRCNKPTDLSKKSTLEYTNPKLTISYHDELNDFATGDHTIKHDSIGSELQSHLVEVSCTVFPNDNVDGEDGSINSSAMNSPQPSARSDFFQQPSSATVPPNEGRSSEKIKPAEYLTPSSRSGVVISWSGNMGNSQGSSQGFQQEPRPKPAAVQRVSGSLQRTSSNPELHTTLPRAWKETSENTESDYAMPMHLHRTDKVEPQPYLEFKPTYSYAYGMVGSRLKNYRGKPPYENGDTKPSKPRPKKIGLTQVRSVTSPLATPDYAEISDFEENTQFSMSSVTNSSMQSAESIKSEVNGAAVQSAKKKPELKPKPFLSKEQLALGHSSRVAKRNHPAIKEKVVKRTSGEEGGKGRPHFELLSHHKADCSSVNNGHLTPHIASSNRF